MRWVPWAARHRAARGALTAAVGAVLVPVLRDAGWTCAGRWLSAVLVAPDGAVVDLDELPATAVDTGDPTPVRALLPAAATEAAA